MIQLSTLTINPDNPRHITDERFERLVKSLKEFPKMMRTRPIVFDCNKMIIGGTMRFRALNELGYTEIPDEWASDASDFTPEECQRFIVVDNIGFGEWDYEIIAAKYDTPSLIEWGMDMVAFNLNAPEDPPTELFNYSRKVTSPTYETSNEKPRLSDLRNMETYNSICREIDQSAAEPEMKDFLFHAATRFIEFNYAKIADYYAHSDTETQALMERLALVIIDFKKAIELGFVKLTEEIAKQYEAEYYEE